jgi:large conductance mechanosensitive channel
MAKLAAAKNVMGGFMDFVHQYNVLPLAVGVVIGVAVNDLVKVIVDGLVSPLVALVSPDGALAGLSFTVGESVFMYGSVIDAFIRFLSVALVVYVVVRLVLKQDPNKKTA